MFLRTTPSTAVAQQNQHPPPDNPPIIASSRRCPRDRRHLHETILYRTFQKDDLDCLSVCSIILSLPRGGCSEIAHWLVTPNNREFEQEVSSNILHADKVNFKNGWSALPLLIPCFEELLCLREARTLRVLDVEVDVVSLLFSLNLVAVESQYVLKSVVVLHLLVQEIQAAGQRVLVDFQYVVVDEKSWMIPAAERVKHQGEIVEEDPNVIDAFASIILNAKIER